MHPKRLLLRAVLPALLVASVWTPPAMAYIYPPTLNPENAAIGELVHLQMESGYCDGIVSDPDGVYPQITISGNQIHIMFFSVHYDPGPDCIFGPGTLNYPIGQFDAGDYIVTVDRFYPDIGGTTTETLGQLALTVGGGSPAAQQLPVNLPLYMWGLLFALGAIACRALQLSDLRKGAVAARSSKHRFPLERTDESVFSQRLEKKSAR